MRYCTKCKIVINSDESTACPMCGKKTITDPSHFSPVRIKTANGFELERIRASLEDAGIPYSYNETARDTGLQILNSAPPENCDVYVPLSAYADACDVLAGIGALGEDELPDADSELLKKAKQSAAEEKELDPKKARVVRILSLIAFLIILAGVVYLTDFLVELIKQAFTH